MTKTRWLDLSAVVLGLLLAVQLLAPISVLVGVVPVPQRVFGLGLVLQAVVLAALLWRPRRKWIAAVFIVLAALALIHVIRTPPCPRDLLYCVA